VSAGCGHPLCELIGGVCSIVVTRSRGCTPAITARNTAPELLDEVRALLPAVESGTPEGRSAAERLAAIIRREALDGRHLLAQCRIEEPDLVAPLEALCVRRR